LKWSFDSLRAYCTTNKRPAFPLVSRPYRIGYSALAVLVVETFPLLPSLDPLYLFVLGASAQVKVFSFRYSIVKVLLFLFLASMSNKKRCAL
jgi:hypothetical protein